MSATFQVSNASVFFDTNILLYLLSGNTEKSDCAENLMASGGTISVQVLNEFTSVAFRKFHMNFHEISEFLNGIRSIVTVKPLGVKTHETGLYIAERYRFSFYDALIVASALRAGCNILYTEDLQHQQIIETQLTVVNPF